MHKTIQLTLVATVLFNCAGLTASAAELWTSHNRLRHDNERHFKLFVSTEHLVKAITHAEKTGNFDHARRYLVEYYTNANANKQHLSYALGYVQRDINLAKLLIEHGADPYDAIGFDGKTILHEVTHPSYSPEIMQFYLEQVPAHVDIRTQDGHNKTPLMYLAENSVYYSNDEIEECLKKLELLLRHKADINAVTSFGVTILQLAHSTKQKHEAFLKKMYVLNKWEDITDQYSVIRTLNASATLIEKLNALTVNKT